MTDLVWRKSTRSGSGNSNCVEIACGDGVVLVRDSKDPDGPVLRFAVGAWRAFVASLPDLDAAHIRKAEA